MRANKRRDTRFETSVRSQLHSFGLRFRVDFPVKPEGHRAFRVDIAFTRHKLAIQCDGCFWHGCPEHGRRKTSRNQNYWGPKIQRNRQRDGEQDRALRNEGWTVMRFWEHEDPHQVALTIWDEVQGRRH
jgi:DNA mismatch endonuclease (patch repair protein)